MTNTYTGIDLSSYYKEWDGQCYQGNKVRLRMINDDGDKIQLFFRILNHSLAIQWIKDLHKELTENKKYIFKNNTVEFEDCRYNSITASDVLCFDDNEYQIVSLKTNVFRNFTNNMYDIVFNTVMKTNFIVDFNYKDGKDFCYFEDTTKEYNISYQDRTLLQEIDSKKYKSLNSGQIYLGYLEFIVTNGKENYNFDFNKKGLKLIDIEIGMYECHNANLWDE